MPTTRRLIHLAVLRQEGFTLIEILTAMVILTVALVGVGMAVAVQSGGMASSFPVGQAAVTRGYYISTAAMLAQERLEEVKRVRYSLTGGGPQGNDPVDNFGADPTPTGFADESSVTDYPSFGRQVRVTTDAPAPNMKTVTVTVTFNLPKESGIGQESIAISTLIAARPE